MLRTDSDHDWKRFGAEDPYYSVLNSEEHRATRLTPESRDALLQTGESRVAAILEFAGRHSGKLSRRRALEFGCGVGRLLIPLARRFDSVCGVDISPGMLAEARSNCERAGIANVVLAPSDDALSRVEGSFDFALSYLVLQHIPDRRGEAIVRQILSRMNPGGVAALHVTYARSASLLRHSLHVLRRNLRPVHYAANLLSGSRWDEPLMHCHLYDLGRLLEIASAEKAGDVALQTVRHGDHHGALIYFHKQPH